MEADKRCCMQHLFSVHRNMEWQETAADYYRKLVTNKAQLRRLIGRVFYVTGFFVQAPFYPSPAGDVEENKTVEGGEIAFVNRWKELGSDLELPVELKISHGHLATTEKSRRARFKPQHYRQPSQKFDDPAEPELGPRRRLELGKHPQNFLGTVE